MYVIQGTYGRLSAPPSMRKMKLAPPDGKDTPMVYQVIDGKGPKACIYMINSDYTILRQRMKRITCHRQNLQCALLPRFVSVRSVLGTVVLTKLR